MTKIYKITKLPQALTTKTLKAFKKMALNRATVSILKRFRPTKLNTLTQLKN